MGTLLKGETKATATMSIKKQRTFFQQRARNGKGKKRKSGENADYQSDSKYNRRRRGKKRTHGKKRNQPDRRDSDKGTRNALKKIQKRLDLLNLPVVTEGARKEPSPNEKSEKHLAKKCHGCKQMGHIKANCPNSA